MTTLASESFLQYAFHLLEKRLDALVPPTEGPSSEMVEAVRYALLGPGKKLRPSLALAVYSLYHHDLSLILDAACSIEMIHTYSLIHDDLPALDNDDIRRGRPTVHKAFSESTAILAGDFLLTHAFDVLASTKLPDRTLLQMIQEMSRLSGGYHGMIAGQAIDLKSEGRRLSEGDLKKLHSLKTGALIELSVLFGLLAANAPEEDRASLMQFGRLYGLGFQVVDDIVDILHPQEKHGKTLSSDLANHKATYVSLLGLEGATERAHQLLSEATQCLKRVQRDTFVLNEFVTLLLNKLE